MSQSIVAVVVFQDNLGPGQSDFLNMKTFEANDEAEQFYEKLGPLKAILIQGHALGVRRWVVVNEET